MADDTQAAIPVDAHPDPVVEYAVSDAGVRVLAANTAFETTFVNVDPEMPLSELFAAFDTVRAAGDAAPETQIARGTSTGIYLDGFDADTGPHVARVLATAEDSGFLEFRPVEPWLDLVDSRTNGTDAVVEAGDVASVISHDLRNPLDVANAHLRAARETGDPEHFDAVASAHDRMERIVRDVLTLAKGREAIDPTEQTAIDAAAREAWRSVDTEGAVLEISDALPTATADADRLRRLFENLFRNAVEHAESPHQDLTVRVGGLDDGFFVADDGPGIDPDERDAVFDPGYSTTGAGTGLGLAIVDRIVAAHDWSVTLRTARDGGARFEIRF
jgi:signal transduction histidine kinase